MMKPCVFIFTLALALVAAATEETREEIGKNEVQISAIKEREETTEKNAPQVLSYNPLGTRDLVYPNSIYPTNTYPNRIYPNRIYPNSIYPTNINPYDSSNPASNPAYNPSANPTNYYPTNYYPTRTNGGGYVGNGLSEAFTVRRASPYTRPGSKIVFTESVTQVGTGWNTARSEFVATAPGLFFFTFSAVSDRYKHFRISLKKNGVDVVSAYGDATGFQMGSQTAVLNLSAGDRVYLQLEEGSVYDVTSSRAYTSFAGFKIV